MNIKNYRTFILNHLLWRDIMTARLIFSSFRRTYRFIRFTKRICAQNRSR